ncbi:ECF transporter S component [Thermococcus celer]|uniref:ECF transporter S component n=1 Tax=Thermococcus celer Vu 13 = JCM 8558 TaxID=1293037 RepID=A0A218P3H7_THECE|nr:ECF transporter S component [Thermococcus celer]ASI99479.1 hypothetical protein A3L02_07865 [Thermococcus celer Vu 13 = JCM 8558]
MVDLTEVLKPYGGYVLAGAVIVFIAYVWAKRREYKAPSTIAVSAILAALVAVVTNFIKVPTPATGGYINIGDTMVMFSAMVFGPVVGVFAGGVGSALGDILGGYAGWAPITLVVKGLEGLAIGYIARNSDDVSTLVIAGIIGGLIMVSGYFAFEAYMFGVPAALEEVPGNTVQAITGIIVGVGLATVIKKRYPEVVDLI